MKVCKVCKLKIHSNEKFVECILCSEFFHSDTKEKNCAEISPTEERVVALTSVQPKLLYRCVECFETGNSSLNINSKKFSNILDQFNASILSFKEATETFKELSDKVKKLQSSQQEIIQDKLPEINDRLSRLENKNIKDADALDAITTQKIISEINEQKNISKNVMIFNLKEYADEKKNSNQVIKLLKNNNISVNNITIKRIGKYNAEKCRPVKIIFKNYYEAIKMIKKSRIIARNSKKNIYITNDKTKSQQQLEKEVSQELRSRKEKGESNIVKKYVNSIPTIVSIADASESENDLVENSESEDNISKENSENNNNSISSVYTTPDKTKDIPSKKNNVKKSQNFI